MKEFAENIIARLAELQNLAHVQQDPTFHGEGDVLTHTRMVLDALFAEPMWGSLVDEEQRILCLAALFHDLGKLKTTVNDHGVIRSPNHSLVGSKMTQFLIWQGAIEDVSFQTRRQVVSLVRHHIFPGMFVEKNDPERSLLEISQHTSLKLLYLLALADMKGRICCDRQALVDKVEFFRQHAEELGCFDRPYLFYNDHTRWRFFRSVDLARDVELYDDTTFEVTLMSGLPGSGKDSWIADNCPGSAMVSLDAIRADLGITPVMNQGRVVQEAKLRAKTLLKDKIPFVWNATNTTRKMRAQQIDLFAAYGARTRIVYIERPREVHLLQNRNRKAEVPEGVIEKLAWRLDVPTLSECHDVVYDVVR